jgi:hypothetical protein
MGHQRQPGSPLTFRKRGSTLSSLSESGLSRHHQESQRRGLIGWTRTKRGGTACEEENRYSRRKSKLKIADGRWKKQSPHGVSGQMLGASGRCDGSLSVRGMRGWNHPAIPCLGRVWAEPVPHLLIVIVSLWREPVSTAPQLFAQGPLSSAVTSPKTALSRLLRVG